MSSLIRNVLRLALGAVFVLALPCAGYLWSQPDSRSVATSMAVGAIVALAVFEAMTRARESHARGLQYLIKKDEDEFAEFKEKVRLLDGVVHILWQDNAELRRGRLVGEIELLRQQASSLADQSSPKAIDDATAKLLALPQPESSSAAQQDAEGTRHE